MGKEMNINRLFQQGTLVANLISKQTKELARIYACDESRGYQTDYRQRRFFFFVPYKNSLPSGVIRGITKDTRRKNITQYSEVTIIDDNLWQEFIS